MLKGYPSLEFQIMSKIVVMVIVLIFKKNVITHVINILFKQKVFHR